MGKRRRMIDDTVLATSVFLGLHREAQLLYVFLTMFTDDDGIVDPYPVMAMTHLEQIVHLEELVDAGLLYPIEAEKYTLFYVVHFFVVMNKIPPSKK